MKNLHKFIKMSGCKSEKEFYQKYKSDKDFFKEFPKALDGYEADGDDPKVLKQTITSLQSKLQEAKDFYTNLNPKGSNNNSSNRPSNMSGYLGSQFSDSQAKIIAENLGSASGTFGAIDGVLKGLKPLENIVDNAYYGLQQGLLQLPNLLPAAKADKNPMRTLSNNQFGSGTGSQAIYKFGGDIKGKAKGLQVLNGGKAEQMSNNPYDGGTQLFEGRSHDDGGIKIMYNGFPVEVQGNEPGFVDSKGDYNIFGAMKVPGSKKTFQSVGKEIGKYEAKANKIQSKATDLEKLPVYTKFSALKATTADVLKDAANQRLKTAAIQKENLANIQNTILEFADENKMKPKKAAEKFAKNGIKVSYDDGQTWETNKTPWEVKEIEPKLPIQILNLPNQRTPETFPTSIIQKDVVHDLMGNKTSVPNLPHSWNRRQIDDYFASNPENDITNYNQYEPYMKDGGSIPKAYGGYNTKNKAMEDNLTPVQMKYADMIMEEALRRGLSREEGSYAQRQMWEESRLTPGIVSDAGAVGIAQFMPGTAKQYGIREGLHGTDDETVKKHIAARFQYMEDLKNKFGGDRDLATIAYNWGEGRVSKKLKQYGSKEELLKHLPPETENYFKDLKNTWNDDFYKGRTYSVVNKETEQSNSKAIKALPLKMNGKDVSRLGSLPVQITSPTNIPYRGSGGQKFDTQKEANESFRTPISEKKIPSLADKNKLSPFQFLSDIPALLARPDYVQGQEYQPELYTPYSVSFDDRLNENNTSFRSIQQQLSNNPEALSILAGQKYQQDNNILAEQFRTNQGILNDVTNKNVSIKNDSQMKNIELRDQQFVRQEQAKANTKDRAQAALVNMENKIAQHKAENNTIRLYENLFKYRPNDNMELKNYNPPAALDWSGSNRMVGTTDEEQADYLEARARNLRAKKAQLAGR